MGLPPTSTDAATSHREPWIADPCSGELRRREQRARLEPKLMEVLLALHARAGEVVSKQRLLEEVWTGCYVSDDVVWRSISVLRRTLGDDPRRPWIIETLPRRGYRYLGGIVFEGSAGHPPKNRRWPSWLSFFFLA